MRLGVKPATFLLRLLLLFAATYALWALTPLASAYTHVLAALTQGAMSLTEWFGDAATRGATSVFARGEGIYFTHRLFPDAVPPGIPGDWVQANLVLLIPLMLATPAPDWPTRLRRLAIALACALALQVIGLVVAIKTTWATELGGYSFTHYSRAQRFVYGFLDAFFQSFDTQLFPFAIWAGIHLPQLIATVRAAPATAPSPQQPSRPHSRHKAKAAARAARS
ncbi:MAG TPA: hypothetical protein VMW17_03495 [Candidatus Binatia bacterium]|nr:hypothetical protein [Candidatus Binatia bacterium]